MGILNLKDSRNNRISYLTSISLNTLSTLRELQRYNNDLTIDQLLKIIELSIYRDKN